MNAIKALEQKLRILQRYEIRGKSYVRVDDLSVRIDELAAILRQIEAAPSPPEKITLAFWAAQMKEAETIFRKAGNPEKADGVAYARRLGIARLAVPVVKDSLTPVDSSQGEPVAWNIEVVPVVVRDVSDAHYVRLSIGCQHFNIGPDYLDTRADAEWFKTQLDTALRRAKPAEPVEADHVDVWARHQVASLRYWLGMSVARFAAKASVCELNNDEMQTLAEARSALAAFLYTPSVNSTMPLQDEPLFTASMYGTAERAAKAREEWLAAKVEPQWQPIETAPKDGTLILVAGGDLHRPAIVWYARDSWAGDYASRVTDQFPYTFTIWTPLPTPIEQRARSLAQAEQAAKESETERMGRLMREQDDAKRTEIDQLRKDITAKQKRLKYLEESPCANN